MSYAYVRPSELWHCWLGRVTRKTVSEMIYNVSSGTLYSTVPYLYIHKASTHWRQSWIQLGRPCRFGPYKLATKSTELATMSTATSCRIRVVDDLSPVSATVDFFASVYRVIESGDSGNLEHGQLLLSCRCAT